MSSTTNSDGPYHEKNDDDDDGSRMANTASGAEELAQPDGRNDEEEYWPTPSLLTGHKIHTIRFGSAGKNEPRILRYKSMPTEELTPLDMTYGNSKNSQANDEFYDGTGNLMWMAAICFGHLVFQEVEPLRSYLLHGSATPNEERNKPKKLQRRQFCELGCGTGGAGISLLLSASENVTNSDSSAVKPGNYHVVFTDNDSESLELCASNCQLNGLSQECYSQQLLGWGSEHLERAQRDNGLKPNTFDVVFATDVIYDLKMIAPLFETVDFLLKKKKKALHWTEETNIINTKGGHLVLSHVPRFCIPKDATYPEADQDSSRSHGHYTRDHQDEDSPTEAFLELEHFIQSEASKVGLNLTKTIRPHQVLSEEGLAMQDCSDDDNKNDDDSMQQLTLETMKEAHAVVFVFERS